MRRYEAAVVPRIFRSHAPKISRAIRAKSFSDEPRRYSPGSARAFAACRAASIGEGFGASDRNNPAHDRELEGGRVPAERAGFHHAGEERSRVARVGAQRVEH